MAAENFSSYTMAPSTTRTCGAKAVEVVDDLGGAFIFLKLTILLVLEGDRVGSVFDVDDAEEAEVPGISLPSPESFKKYDMVLFSELVPVEEVEVAIEAASFGPDGNLMCCC